MVNPKFLLGYKKVRFGAGKVGGIGGKLDPGETILASGRAGNGGKSQPLSFSIRQI